MARKPITIRIERFYPHPPEDVWTALTDPHALSEWFEPNNHQPVVGHKFQFRCDPGICGAGAMKPIDFLKATGVAAALLALKCAHFILVIVVYRFLIEPGHPREFYDAAAQRIAPWCSHIAGTALFLGAGYLFTKSRPDCNGLLFAAAFTALYAIVDSATIGFAGIFEFEFALSMLAKLVAALVGAYVATRKTGTPAPTPEQ